MGPSLGQIMEPRIWSKCLGICIREIIPSVRSRNLVSRVGHEILETIPPPGSGIHRPVYPDHLQTNPAQCIRYASQASTLRGGTYQARASCRRRRPHPNPILTLNDPRYGDRIQQYFFVLIINLFFVFFLLDSVNYPMSHAYQLPDFFRRY